ncbi:MAG: TolC family protein, partial [Coleofasciculus sp. C2-GNP5-27]
DVLTQAAQAAFTTIAAQKRLALLKDSFALAQRVFETASERVKFGKVPLLEKTKARILVSSSQIELEKAKRQLDAARTRLAATWGSTNPQFASVQGEFGAIHAVPALEVLKKFINDNPDIERSKSKVKLQQSSFELEQARDLPDVTVNAGVKRIEENNGSAFVLGFSVPMPFFGINPGGVQEARERIAQSRKLQQAKLVGITTALSEAYQTISSAYHETQALTKEVLPGAEEAFTAASQGYKEGKFGFLQVLDAQRTLFETRGKFIDAVASYHRSKLEVERLIGRPLEAVQKPLEISPKEAPR